MFIYILQERKYGGFVNILATLDGQVPRFTWLNDDSEAEYKVEVWFENKRLHNFTELRKYEAYLSSTGG